MVIGSNLSSLVEFLVPEGSVIQTICMLPNKWTNKPKSSAGSIFPFESHESSKTAMTSFPTEAVARFTPLFKRIESLSQLHDGWFDGEGKTFNSNDLDWLQFAFLIHYSEGLPFPYIYPTPEGCARAEWTLDPYEISLEIDLRHRTGEWHSLNFNDAQDDSESIDLSIPKGWGRLSDRLSEILGAIA